MQFMIEEEFVALMVNLIFLKWSNLALLHKHVLSALLEQFWAFDSVVNSDTCEAEHVVVWVSCCSLKTLKSRWSHSATEMFLELLVCLSLTLERVDPVCD